MSLFTKYPELEALSMFVASKKGSFVQKEAFPLEVDASILFVFGIFPLVEDFKSFIASHRGVEVVFIVETLAEVLHFAGEGKDGAFASDQLHVRWKEGDDEEFAEKLAREFPYEKVAFLRNGIKEKEFTAFKQLLLRKLTLETAVHKELINYPRLCENLVPNLFLLSKAFDIGQWKDVFKGVPAVIAGAGPSLVKAKEALLQVENKGLIFAGGSTITALDQMGISAHLNFAIDPNLEEYERLRYSFSSSPIVYANRVQKDIFRFFPGQKGYIRSDTGGMFESFVEERLGVKDYGILENLSEEALSVTTVALMTAIHLGCSPIYFAGIDLSCKKKARYSGDILTSWEQQIKSDPMQEVKWMMERRVIDKVAEDHPTVSFFDATGDGTTFAKFPVKELDLSIMDDHGSLRGRIDDLILGSKFAIQKESITEVYKEIESSLNEGAAYIEKFLSGDMPYSLLVYELENNRAYDLFFKGMVYALEVPLRKKVRVEGKEYTQEHLARSIFSKVLKEARELSLLIAHVL